MLRMDQVHVVRHKVLVEGRSQRAVARELGLSRSTVGKYVGQAAPVRKAEAGPRPRPVWDAVHGRVQAVFQILGEKGGQTPGQNVQMAAVAVVLAGQGRMVAFDRVKRCFKAGKALKDAVN